MTYTLTLSTGEVVRDSDGVIIAPCQDPSEQNFVDYINWCHAGNSPTVIERTQAEIDAMNAALVDQYTNSLWQAAHDFEYAQISGVAVGLLTIGVIKQTPKALAIAGWSASVWNLYYARKALLTSVEDITMYDFSSIGPLPYSIPELRVELGM